jgi:hypothetical protein
MEKKIVQEKEKWEGEMKPKVAERGSHPHTPMANISSPACVGNDSTTPNSTTGNTTHAGAFM